jgi:hypothetical protein
LLSEHTWIDIAACEIVIPAYITPAEIGLSAPLTVELPADPALSALPAGLPLILKN